MVIHPFFLILPPFPRNNAEQNALITQYTSTILKKALRILAVILLLAAIVVPAQAQRRVIHYLPKYEHEPYHFGFLLAYNQMMFTIKTAESYQNTVLSPELWPNSGDVPYAPSSVSSFKIYNVETIPNPGFTVGIIGSKRLGRYFDLRFSPSLSFSESAMSKWARR